MTISETATLLKKELENPHICGKIHFLPESFVTKLDELIALRCTKICKDGGGNPECHIRKCCVQKRIDGCWECDDFESCDKLKDQYINNIKIIKDKGFEGYLKERSR
jgi:hypothetical protein